MNLSQAKSTSMSGIAELFCVASAILVASYLFQWSGLLGTSWGCQAPIGADPSAFAYAHSVPFKQPGASHPEPLRYLQPDAKRSMTIHPWYRYALPLSSAVFLLTFGIWSLQTQPNLAISSLDIATRESINQATADECCDTPPTSACQHATAKQGLPLSGPTLDPSR